MSIFSKIPIRKPKHTVHNLSYSNKLTAEFGRLYPFLCRKVVPGDRFVGNDQVFCQFAAMNSKVYQEFTIKTEYFFVPSRIVWNDFEDFIVGGFDGQQTYVHPFINYTQIFKNTFQKHGTGTTDDPYYYENLRFSEAFHIGVGGPVHGSLYDYFNLPTVVNKQYLVSINSDTAEYYQIVDNVINSPTILLDAMPFTSLLKVYIDHYADENLQHDLIEAAENLFHDVPLNYGNDWTTYVEIGNVMWMDNEDVIFSQYRLNCKRNYPKDYFTGALPFVQKGAQVNIPFEGDAPVYSYLSSNDPALMYNNVERTGGSNPGAPPHSGYYAFSENVVDPNVGSAHLIRYAHFSNGLAAINDLRTAEQVQVWLETNARGGTRYNEQILSHFGVRTPDSRLDRSEFIMSHRTPVTLGNVYTTTLSGDDNAEFVAGEPISVAKGAGKSRNWKFRANEHGYILGIVSIYPKASYFKGIPREFFELDKFDYYWPEFQHIGDQDLKSLEVYMGTERQTVFGYNPRYAHYKTALNQIHGDFRDSLKFMTDARDFYPAKIGEGQYDDINLSSQFININPETNNLNRVFNYTLGDYDHVQLDIFVRLKPSRPMSYFGIPRLV